MTLSTDAPRIFDSAPALPRGPHGLSREEVADSQRTRLMAAMADAVAELGYAHTTIAEITKRAGVSPSSFYEHFDDKLACYLAGYDTLAQFLIEQIAPGLGDEADWPSFVETSLSAYLRTMEANRAVARAFLVEIDAAGPEARDRRRRAYARFAAVFRARHELIQQLDPALGPLPDRVYLAMVFAIRDLVADALEHESAPSLTALAPDALFLVLAATHGALAAARELA